jgi:hypothetical protein
LYLCHKQGGRMRGQTYLIGLVALGVTWRLAAQNVGIGTSAPDARLHVQTPSTADFIRTGWFQNQRNAADNNGVLIDIARAATDAYALNVRSGVGAGLTSRLYVRGDGNVGIGTTTPEARLHVNGRAIVDDGTTGTPTNSTWGSAGSRIILWPGSATATPYQIGIASSEMWTGVPSGASWSVFRGTARQLIVRPTSHVCHVNNNYNFPSIMLGDFGHAYSAGPYPKRGTFVYFAGPTNNFEDNTDPAFMYFAHIARDVSRLRLHVEDNYGGPDEDGFSILGSSCSGTCFDIATSSLLFDFVSNGQAYKPGGGNWAAISDARLKEDIHPYTRGLAELRALRPVRYKYKKEYWAASDRHFTGLIAQEVQDVVPEMVHPYKFQAIGDRLLDVLAVDPSDLTYMLINAVKELDAENQQLKARLAAVEAEKQALEARLSVIESRLSALEGLRGSKE